MKLKLIKLKNKLIYFQADNAFIRKTSKPIGWTAPLKLFTVQHDIIFQCNTQ